MTRADLLGQIMKNYQIPIAVSGTTEKPQQLPWLLIFSWKVV